MELLKAFLEVIIHLDKHLDAVVSSYGIWTHAILFLIIFCETGLVVAPLLPGDSLLFAAGTISALGSLNISLLILSLSTAAILGDTINYWAGYIGGQRIFGKEKSRFFKREYLDRTHKFYERYGGKTIIIARFIPVIRTFAPFVAGVGRMTYTRFIVYNVAGGVAWISFFIFAGKFFGSIPFIRQNFSIVILAIIFLSLIPGVVEFIRHKYREEKNSLQ